MDTLRSGLLDSNLTCFSSSFSFSIFLVLSFVRVRLNISLFVLRLASAPSCIALEISSSVWAYRIFRMFASMSFFFCSLSLSEESLDSVNSSTAKAKGFGSLILTEAYLILAYLKSSHL